MKPANITPAQLVAYLSWVGAQAVAFGWIQNTKEQLLLSVGSTVVTAVWKIADAIHQHSKGRVAEVAIGTPNSTAGEVADKVAALEPPTAKAA